MLAQYFDGLIDILLGNDDAQAYSAVKGATHFVGGYAASDRQPVKNRALLPGAELDLRVLSLLQDSWQVFSNAAAGNVRQPFDRYFLDQRQYRAGIDARRLQQQSICGNSITVRVLGDFQYLAD